MAGIIVKENESLDSALRRFKRSCAKAGIQQEIRKRESANITKNRLFVARRNLRLPARENITDIHRIPDFMSGIYFHTGNLVSCVKIRSARMRLVRRRKMQADACAHQRAKSRMRDSLN